MREKKILELNNAVFMPEVGKFVANGHNVKINVRGRSMRPFLENERDKVLLAPFTSLSVGDAVLAYEKSRQRYVLHRIISIKGDDITLMGDGNCHGIEHCSTEDVLGVVKQYIHPNRTVDADNRWLCISIRIWHHLLPIRRYLLWFYRHFFRINP